MNVEKLTAIELLSIKTPERLYERGLDEAKGQYRLLAKRWHPDHNSEPDAVKVFQHIKALFEKAEEKIKNGTWNVEGLLEITANGTNKKYEIRFHKSHPFEMGMFYVGEGLVTYEIGNDNLDLVNDALNVIKSFHYKDDKMKKTMEHSLPRVKTQIFSKDHVYVIIEKDKNAICLRDLVDHIGTIDPKHIAWIISRAYNTACYCELTGITHNALSLDTMFIEPKNHVVQLLGGWWYAAKNGKTLKALPGEALTYSPPDVIATKKASIRIDLELIKMIGRILLGSKTGANLRTSTAPKPMIDWFLLPSTGRAVNDYKIWQEKVLKESFGERRFTELKLNFSDVYL